MCKWYFSNENRIDPCLRKTIQLLQNSFGFHTLACCCGHGKYKPTIVYQNSKGEKFAAIIPDHLPAYLLQGTVKMPRKRRFYQRDAAGVYFIPELMQFISEKNKSESKCSETQEP